MREIITYQTQRIDLEGAGQIAIEETGYGDVFWRIDCKDAANERIYISFKLPDHTRSVTLHSLIEMYQKHMND